MLRLPAPVAFAPRRRHENAPLPVIVIDAPNVAIKHGKGARFSCRGVALAIEYWRAAGHRCIAFLPEFHLKYDRVGKSKRAADLGLGESKHVPDDVPLLHSLEDEGLLVVTPPQDYDDSYCIAYARQHAGCIVSNDLYRDYVDSQAKKGDGARREAAQWCKAHLISFAFIADEFLPNPDFVLPD